MLELKPISCKNISYSIYMFSIFALNMKFYFFIIKGCLNRQSVILLNYSMLLATLLYLLFDPDNNR